MNVVIFLTKQNYLSSGAAQPGLAKSGALTLAMDVNPETGPLASSPSQISWTIGKGELEGRVM